MSAPATRRQALGCVAASMAAAIAPCATSSPASADAALLAACADYQARRLERIALYKSDDPDAADAADDARGAEWDAFDVVAAFPPAVTAAGRAAKAAVALAITERHIEPPGTELDCDLMFARSVLAEMAARPLL